MPVPRTFEIASFAAKRFARYSISLLTGTFSISSVASIFLLNFSGLRERELFEDPIYLNDVSSNANYH